MAGYYTDKGADNNTLLNQVFDSYYGYQLKTNNNYLNNNSATYSTYDGFSILDCHNNVLTGNTAKNNCGWGFDIINSSHDLFENNVAISNKLGQFYETESTNLVFKNNSFPDPNASNAPNAPTTPTTKTTSSSSTITTSSLPLDIIIPVLAILIVVLLKKEGNLKIGILKY